MGKALIRKNVQLAQFTTLKIGGPARYFADARTEKDVADLLAFAKQRDLPLFILGGGSNVLIADEGFQGLVIHIAIEGIEFSSAGDRAFVTAGAGEDWDKLVGLCVEKDLAGIECLSGIPGSVGGTPVQNVGAYGQDVGETIVSVKALDRRSGGMIDLSNAECRFSYRSSLFNSIERDRYVVLAATYRLKPGGEPGIIYPDLKNYFATSATKPSLKEVRAAVLEIRSRKAMVIVEGDPDCRSAGSFFKNPIVDREKFEFIKTAAGGDHVPSYEAGEGKLKVPAAWLIERAGFQKGYQRGRAGISSKHTLAIINRGGATAKEALELAAEIQNDVEEKFGVRLQLEPLYVQTPPLGVR